MPIVWLSVAAQDVLQIRTFIADQDPQSALSHLAKMPKMGRPGRIFGTRELAISGTPFLVIYRVREGRVEILRVLHGRQPLPESI